MRVLQSDPDGKSKLAVGVSEMVGRKPLASRITGYCLKTHYVYNFLVDM